MRKYDTREYEYFDVLVVEVLYVFCTVNIYLGQDMTSLHGIYRKLSIAGLGAIIG